MHHVLLFKITKLLNLISFTKFIFKLSFYLLQDESIVRVQKSLDVVTAELRVAPATPSVIPTVDLTPAENKAKLATLRLMT